MLTQKMTLTKYMLVSLVSVAHRLGGVFLTFRRTRSHDVTDLHGNDGNIRLTPAGEM